MTDGNVQVLLARRPEGWVEESNFQIKAAPMPRPAEGQLLTRIRWLSLDPYMRSRMDEVSYGETVAVGGVMIGGTVGEIVESKHPKFKQGDIVVGYGGWQQYAVSDGSGLMKIPPLGIPEQAFLGVVGMPGITGWYGLMKIGNPKEGETVVVSAASGAVGSVAGQLARIKGCRAVGIAGGKTKCDYVVNELGFDACVDYKQADFYKLLKAATPKGIDIYFENVGGEILDAVLKRLNAGARIPLCGLISGYNGQPIPINNPFALLTSRAHLQGFIISDHLNLWPEAIKELGGYVVAGKIKYRETITAGIENAPRAFIGLLKGENFGKQLIKVS
jgi:NADPH-dependent curcumin reductase CurA